jgi:hypothetical protein
MSSAVHNLQKAISEGSQPLIQLLRQTKLIAAKLNLREVETWVDNELKGYSKDVEPPPYRHVTSSHLQIYHPHYGWRFAGNFSMTIPAWEPIADIENLSHGKTATVNMPKNLPVEDGLGGGLARDWPQRMVIGGSEFKRIVSAVTDELLQWTIELEKRGIKGEDMNFNEKEKQSATNHVYNIQKFTGVLGNVTNSQVTLYDYSSVHQLLVDHNIPKEDRHELADIMDELKTAPPEKKPSLIARGEKLILKHKEALGAAAEILAGAIGAAVKNAGQ